MNGLLIAALSALCGALCCVQLEAALLGFGLCLMCLWRVLRLAGTACCVWLFAIAAWRAETQVTDYRLDHALARQAIGASKRCAVLAEVITSPTQLGDSLSFMARVSRGDCAGPALRPATLVRLYGGPKTLGRGDQFEAIVTLGVIRIFRNADLPDPFPGYARREVTLSGSILALDGWQPSRSLAAHIDRLRAHVRQRIEQTFAPAAMGMAKALVLGENDLTEREDAAFKGSGLAHLLAVSGTHLVFAVVSLVEGLRRLLLHFPRLAQGRNMGRWAAACGVPMALLYADFAGGSGSAWRAAWMLAAAFLVRALGRELGAARAVAASIWVGWLVDPLAVFDLSFMLSLAATSGLLTLGRHYGRWAQRVRHRGLKLVVIGALATVSSMLPCSALLALLTPRISLIGIAANVFAAPFGEVIALPLCLGHALLSFWPALEQGTAVVASGALLVVKQVAFTSHELGWISVRVPFPNAWQMVVVCVTPLVFWSFGRFKFARRGCIGAALAVLAVLEHQAQAAGNPRGLLRVTALDVGQGDSALVDLPHGQLMLIDGGGFVGSPVDPGERVLLPLLRARRRERVDVLVLSHPHPDHYGGLLRVAQTLPIGEFWDTGQGERQGTAAQYRALLRVLRQRGVRIRRPRELCRRRNFSFGGAILDVLGPCPRVISGRNANDNSLVFRIRHGQRAVLFTGDAERTQEQEILSRSRSKLAADLLKVGHHGSRTSTSREFLQAVGPSFATISCGMRNRYGHPHPVTLRALSASWVPFARIDDTGSVSWSTDGENVALGAYQQIGLVRGPPSKN